jgi:hypothetical protein
VSDYGLDDRGSIPDRGRGFFLQPLRPDRLWGQPSLLYSGYRGSFPGGKARPGRDADHSPESSAEVKNGYERAIPPLTPSSSMVCSGITLTFTDKTRKFLYFFSLIIMWFNRLRVK